MGASGVLPMCSMEFGIERTGAGRTAAERETVMRSFMSCHARKQFDGVTLEHHLVASDADTTSGA